MTIFCLLSALLWAMSPLPLWADDSAPVADRACHLYRAKREGVPVYGDPDVTAKVIAKLILGEKVCYIGENREFAIVDWSLQHSLSKGRAEIDGESKLAYVRLHDLWTPSSGLGSNQTGGTKGFWGWLKGYYHYMRSGGVPEDGLIPYRPVLDLVGASPICTDGQLGCEARDDDSKDK